MDKQSLLSRIDALLAVPWDMARGYDVASQVLQGSISVLQAVHGTDCPQIQTLQNRIAAIETSREANYRIPLAIFNAAQGALRNVKGEIEAGFLGTLSRTVTGEVLSDFIQLAKAALDEGDDKSKNVAAVLVAAAFEDTIRRMGSSFCGILTRDDLQSIVTALKTKGILIGSQIGTVQAQLKFRNDALHADWNTIDRVGVGTALQLVQELLFKHFS